MIYNRKKCNLITFTTDPGDLFKYQNLIRVITLKENDSWEQIGNLKREINVENAKIQHEILPVRYPIDEWHLKYYIKSSFYLPDNLV